MSLWSTRLKNSGSSLWGLDQKTPEVGHIKDSLLVGTEEVKELLNTEDEAFYKLIKRLLGFNIISCVAETKLKGKDMEEGVFPR